MPTKKKVPAGVVERMAGASDEVTIVPAPRRKTYAIVVETKHLPGRHNQAAHGRGWRGGQGRRRDARGRFTSGAAGSLPSRAGSAVASLTEVQGDAEALEQAVGKVAAQAKLPEGVKVGKVWSPGDQGNWWKIRLTDDKGREVAVFSRRIKRDGDGKWYVNHDTATVSRDWQRKGIASEVNRVFEDWYRESGVDRITLEAAGGGQWNGGYTWARAGYDWDPDAGFTGPQSTVVNILLNLEKEAKAKNPEVEIPPGVKDQIAEMLKQVRSSSNPADWPTPAELARLGWTPGSSDWLGKMVMRQQSWHGVKKLLPPPGKQKPTGKAPTVDDADLSAEQRSAIYDYTGGYFRHVNGTLRHGEQPYSNTHDLIARLDAAFEAAPPLTAPITVRRNVWNVEAMFGEPGSRVGGEFVDDGFVSTTTGRDASFFGEHQLNIVVPAGSKALDVRAASNNPQEDEVLLPRGTAFKVVSDTVDANGNRIIELHVVG